MKQQNLQLTQEISSLKELLETERSASKFTNDTLDTLDIINAKNDDLNNEITKYKQALKQLESETKSLKTENEKYKLALSNYDQAKQKREEIYKNNLSKSEQTIKSLEQERDSLQLIVSTQFQMLYNNAHLEQDENDNKKQHEPLNSNLPDQTLEILRIASLQSIVSNQAPVTAPPAANRLSICNISTNFANNGLIPHFDRYSTDYLYDDGYNIINDDSLSTPTPKNIPTPPNFSAVNTENMYNNDHEGHHNDMDFENETMIDCGYNTYNHLPGPSVLNASAMSKNADDGQNYKRKSQLIHNMIAQSIKMKRNSLMAYDTDKDKLRNQIEEQLQEINKLREERKTLRQENTEMRQKLNAGFKCSAPWQWFS